MKILDVQSSPKKHLCFFSKFSQYFFNWLRNDYSRNVFKRGLYLLLPRCFILYKTDEYKNGKGAYWQRGGPKHVKWNQLCKWRCVVFFQLSKLRKLTQNTRTHKDKKIMSKMELSLTLNNRSVLLRVGDNSPPSYCHNYICFLLVIWRGRYISCNGRICDYHTLLIDLLSI